MVSVQTCQNCLTNVKTALSDLGAAMAQLEQLTQHITQEKAELQQERAKIDEDRRQMQNDREHFEAEKETMIRHGVGPENLVGLNFRGEQTVVMKRSVLCQVEGSMLAAMFSGRYESNLDYDKDGNVYVGYPPSVMMPLMDWLTTYQDVLPEAQLPTVDIPKGLENMWEGVVNFFGLESVLSSPTNFSGVQQNLPISDLKGWRMALCKPAKELTTMADFSLPMISQDTPVLIGAKHPGKDELIVAAIGRLDAIAMPGTCEHQHNNVYWHLNDHGFAFSDRKIDNFALSNLVYRSYCNWSMKFTRQGSVPFEKVIMIPHSGTQVCVR